MKARGVSQFRMWEATDEASASSSQEDNTNLADLSDSPTNRSISSSPPQPPALMLSAMESGPQVPGESGHATELGTW